MLATLATADSVTWLSIIVKAFAYAATLLAIGSVLVDVSLQGLNEKGRAALHRTAVLSALAAAVLTSLRLPVRASFLLGGTWDGAVDPMILGMVAESPLGTSTAVRLAGLALIFCILWRARTGHILALVGACLASVSFALRGHALGEPQMILGGLITLHILCLAFWVGAFAPLLRATRRDPPASAGALAHEFGHQALSVVGLLVVAGGLVLIILGAATPSALSTPYGQMFAIKLVLFAGVLSLAAVNKLNLTPALLASTLGARRRLRRSIGFEVALVAGILITTATFTSVSSPPGDGEGEQASLDWRPAASAHHTFGDAS